MSLEGYFTVEASGRRALRLMCGIVLLFMGVSGCTTDYTKSVVEKSLRDGYLISNPEITTTRQWVLPAKTSFYVAFPEGGWSVPLRRKMTADLAQAMQGSFINVGFANDPVTLQQSLRIAAERRSQFVIYPQLALYSNKLSSVVEIDEDYEDYRQVGFDRFVLILKMYDTVSHDLVDVTQIKGRSGLVSIERSTPSNLFSGAFHEYADSLLMTHIK